jgi:hypothetical protein
VSNVPTNLIPSRITQLPEYTGSSTLGYLPYVVDGRTFKVQFSNIAAVGAVPSSRSVATGTGLTGGGDLSADRVISVAPAGIGYDQLALSGVTAGTYGTGADVPVVTVDDKGRVTALSTTPLTVTGFVPDTRSVTAGSGLSGGGNLSSDISFSIVFASATPQPLGAASAGVSATAARGDHTHPAVDLSDASQTQGALPLGRGGTGDGLSPIAGAVVYSTGSQFALTGLGLAGQVLVSQGDQAPVWQTLAGGGTVTSVAASGGTTGLTFSGSPITTSGTLTLGGTLAVASGGTGAADASTARSNLGAAASGANSDITSLSGLTGGVSTADYVDFDLTAAPALPAGRIAWNPDDGTIDVGLLGGSVLQTGQKQMYYARNTSGSSIPNGTPVMFTGTVGSSGKLTFGLAVADGSVPPEYMMGVTTQAVPNNEFGYVTTFGLVRGFNTTGTPYGETWSEGDLLYFDPAVAGGWTNIEPQAPNIHVPVAVVMNVASGGSGSIFVRMAISERLNELQDVRINGTGVPLAGQTLIYDATQGRWENHHLTAGTNVSITNGDGSITISSTDQYTGTVTSVAADGGTTGLTFTGSPITTSGTLTLGGTLAVGSGGTGATTATNARANLLPSYTGNAAKVLALNSTATDVEWIASGGTGTVTSVDATGGTGISVSGGPITTSGTLTITNTAPDQVVSLTGAGTTSISGTYPNFTITSNDQYAGTVTSVGGTGTVNGITLTGTVTSSGSLTLGGTLSGVDLTTQVTGTLPVANGGTGATSLSGVVIGNGTSAFSTKTNPTGAFVGTTDTQTLTDKRINPRAVTASGTSGSLTINGDTTDLYVAEGLTGAITLAQPSGTPANGQKLLIRIKDNGTARGITWTTSAGAFRAVGITLPTTTVLGKVTYVGCVYNSADSFWDAIATVTQA